MASWAARSVSRRHLQSGHQYDWGGRRYQVRVSLSNPNPESLLLWTCPRAKIWNQVFLISTFCSFFVTSSDFGKRMRNTPLSNFASTFVASGSNGKGIDRLNEP